MIPVEKLRDVRTIVAHANCPDGLASAMILAHAFPGADVRLLGYMTPELETLPAEPGMLFVDIAPPRSRVQEFVAAGAIVLDHHRHSRDIVEAFGDLGRYADEDEEPGVSGALLAYEVWKQVETLSTRLNCGELVQRFAELAGVRDTWQTRSPDWNEARAQAEALMFYPPEHWIESLRDPWLTFEELQLGGVLVERSKAEAKKMAKGAWFGSVAAGTRLAVVQGRQISDAAELLRKKGANIVAGFELETRDGILHCVWSLRGDGTVDVGAFCKKLGGGGHTRAAGFTEVARPMLPHDQISYLLVDHLKGQV